MTEARRHDAIAIAILGLLATILFFDVLVGTHNFYMRDLTRYYYPTKQVLRDIVLGRRVPVLEPPLRRRAADRRQSRARGLLSADLADPSAQLRLRLPPAHPRAHLHRPVRHVRAAALDGRCARRRRSSARSSFGLGGIYLSYINLLPILFCAAWLPLTCLFVRRFLLAPRLRDFALASLFLGMQFLVGEPTTVMQTGFLIGMYALYRGWYAARDARPAVEVRHPGDALARRASSR